jgi:hypothetical protein
VISTHVFAFSLQFAQMYRSPIVGLISTIYLSHMLDEFDKDIDEVPEEEEEEEDENPEDDFFAEDPESI